MLNLKRISVVGASIVLATGSVYCINHALSQRPVNFGDDTFTPMVNVSGTLSSVNLNDFTNQAIIGANV
jgi:hypothetical protein